VGTGSRQENASNKDAIEDIERFDRYVLLDFWLGSAKHASSRHVFGKKDGRSSVLGRNS
jgi:hypothetical protein